MQTGAKQSHQFLEDGASVVVIGGGPAGAFFSLHLVRRARQLQRRLNVTIIDRRACHCGADHCGLVEGKKGCGFCAGGLSPRLLHALGELDVRLPPEVIQNRIHSITIQGYWKNIELQVPDGREMLSVFRISRTIPNQTQQHNFDAVLLDQAQSLGVKLVHGEVCEATRDARGRPVISYRDAGVEHTLEADFAVFATGVNALETSQQTRHTAWQVFRKLNPRYAPPQLRRSLVFEIETPTGAASGLDGELHFIEYGSQHLHLEMCSILPKSGYLTVVLVGPSIDAAQSHDENWHIIQEFLALPHVAKLLPPRTPLRVICTCNPWLTTGTARHPFADRVAAVGDMVTSRLYKDGILSAYQTGEALAEAILTWGTDEQSLTEAYSPTIGQFRRDNRFASVVFLLHRIIFASSILSRVLYQAVITERKTKPASQRALANLLWKIASGDEDYEVIFKRMIQPATLWLVMTGGVATTLRNYLAEIIFGLKWEGFGRFTTGVAKERFEMKRRAFARLVVTPGSPIPDGFEFERMYTIRIRTTLDPVRRQLERFGEPNRGYLHPRWVSIERLEGLPNTIGCVIRYQVLKGLFSFTLRLERIHENHVFIYRVQNGFARDGVLLFDLEPAAKQTTNLSIYVAFDFARGENWRWRLFWWGFRTLFPDFVHDVIWNHALCELKNTAEANDEAASPS